jgi:predicted Holliday junction resolvase-like endonuclease
MVTGDETFLFYVMFWTIIAMMLVLLFSLKQVIMTQRHIENMDRNLEKIARRTLLEEERIVKDVEDVEEEEKIIEEKLIKPKKSSSKKTTKKTNSKKSKK